MAVSRLDGGHQPYRACVAKHAVGVRIPKGGFIAGGCFKDWLTGRRPKDVDIFFRSEADWERALLDMEMEREKVYQNDHAVAFAPERYGGPHIELVSFMFGEPREVLEAFDFTVCQMAWDAGELYAADAFFEDLMERRLRLAAMPSPVGTYLRMLRYCGYGFHPDAETAKKVGEALMALPEGTEIDLSGDYIFG